MDEPIDAAKQTLDANGMGIASVIGRDGIMYVLTEDVEGFLDDVDEIQQDERDAKPSEAMPPAAQSGRSEEGITVGLVDAIIGIARVLAPRDLHAEGVQEALADLFEDPDFRTVRNAQAAGAGVVGDAGAA